MVKKKVSDTKKVSKGTSLAVQWLGLCAFNAKGAGSIPGRGTNILQAKKRQPPIKKEGFKGRTEQGQLRGCVTCT